MSRLLSWLLFRLPLLLLFVVAASHNLAAEEPEPLTVTAEVLVELGEAVTKTEGFKDNHFIYEARVEQLQEVARSLEEGMTEVTAVVLRVTPYEVLVEVPRLERTRIVLKHDRLPEYGNLGSRRYPGPPSTVRGQMFAKPIGMRIDEEISLELAKQLRRGDRLLVRGRIEAMPLMIKSIFDPFVAAVIADWEVIAYEPGGEEGRAIY